MNIENAKAQMRKGILEFCILSILKDSKAYSSDIITRLKNAKLIVVEGTMYPLLNRLKNSGLLSYEWEESNSGPPRKYYKITSKGIEFLYALGESWIDLQNAINKITQKIDD